MMTERHLHHDRPASRTSGSSGEPHLSVGSRGEIARHRHEAREDRPAAGYLAVWLETLRRDFADRILPVGDAIALEWGRLAALRPCGDAGRLVAATAIIHNLA